MAPKMIKKLSIEKENQQKTPSDSKKGDGSKEGASKQESGTAAAADVDPSDKFKRYENEGVVVKAKLIGSELVLEPRGDKMCQNSIQRLKAIIKGTNSHKKRIVLKISYDGVKVYDEKTNEILHHHEVSQISYIASDDTDNRTFGYVCDVPNKAHLFICFKTSGPAIEVMSVISALFEAVMERKNSGLEGGDVAESTAATETIGQDKNGDSNSNTIISAADILSSIVFSSSSASSAAATSKPMDIPAAVGSPALRESNAINYNSKISTSSTTTPTTIHSSFPRQNSMMLNQQQQQQQQSSIDLIGGDSGILDIGDISFISGFDKQSSIDHSVRSGEGNITTSNSATFLPPPPSSLPRPAPMMMASSGPVHNRSLVYNHSSVSLSDAALTRQLSYTAPSQVKNNQSSIHTDRYAVFNDIDSLPSIFESLGVGSRSNSSADPVQIRQARSQQPQMPQMQQPLSQQFAQHQPLQHQQSIQQPQMNPFDDDFFS